GWYRSVAPNQGRFPDEPHTGRHAHFFPGRARRREQLQPGREQLHRETCRLQQFCPRRFRTRNLLGSPEQASLLAEDPPSPFGSLYLLWLDTFIQEALFSGDRVPPAWRPSLLTGSGLASLTRRLLPAIFWPFSASTASCARRTSGNSTNANPREAPVSRSRITCTDSTLKPYCSTHA